VVSGLLDHNTYAYIHTDIMRKSSLGLHYMVVVSRFGVDMGIGSGMKGGFG